MPTLGADAPKRVRIHRARWQRREAVEEALHPGRREHHDDPRRLGADVLKAVRRPTRHEHERRPLAHVGDVVAQPEPQRALEHVPRLVLAGVRVERRTVAGSDDVLEQRQRRVRLLAARLERQRPTGRSLDRQRPPSRDDERGRGLPRIAVVLAHDRGSRSPCDARAPLPAGRTRVRALLAPHSKIRPARDAITIAVGHFLSVAMIAQPAGAACRADHRVECERAARPRAEPASQCSLACSVSRSVA